MQGLQDSIVQVENKVTEVEVKQDNATLSYIDTTHSDQQEFLGIERLFTIYFTILGKHFV